MNQKDWLCRGLTQYKRQILEVENLIALVGSNAVKRSYEA